MAENPDELKDLDIIRQIYSKSHESRDKALLTLCSASLAVSLTFFEKVYTGHALWLLKATWICLGASMLCTLYSFITAAYTADRLDTYTRNKEKYENDEKFSRCVYRGARCTKWLNSISTSGFTLGVILFIIFAIINTRQGDKMSDPRELQNGLPPLSSMMPDLTKGIPPLSSTMPAAPVSAPAAPAVPAVPAAPAGK